MPSIIGVLTVILLLVGGAATYLLKQLGESNQLLEFQQLTIETLQKRLSQTLRGLQQLQAKERASEEAEAKHVHDPATAAEFGNDILRAHGASTGAHPPVLPPAPVAKPARMDMGCDSWQSVCWSPMAAGGWC